VVIDWEGNLLSYRRMTLAIIWALMAFIWWTADTSCLLSKPLNIVAAL